MPPDKASICSPTQIPPAPLCHLPGPYLLIALQHLRPNKDWVIFIAIKTEKAVTIYPLLPHVYDSYLLTCGCPGASPIPFHHPGALYSLSNVSISLKVLILPFERLTTLLASFNSLVILKFVFSPELSEYE